MDNVIQLTNIKKSYNDAEVLHGIDLTIKKGEFCAIIGQSGSGKSTLLNIIGTLDNATSGEVIINNTDVSTLKKKQLANLKNRDLGFIFQFHYLLEEFNVLDNVLMPNFISESKPTYKNKDQAYELIKLVGLEGLEMRKSSALSGGQKQRVAIARALMNKPAILLADEPTGNLDSETTEKIYNLFRQINKQLGTTIIIITHDNSVAQKADRIVEIKDGNIINNTVH